MIEWLLIGTAWIWGVKAITTHPFIFYKQADLVESFMPRWFIKPMYRCPVCMSSVHGTILFMYGVWSNPFEWIVFIIALAGIQFLLVEFLYPENVEDIQEEKEQ